MLRALVEEEPAGEAPDLSPVDEEMERELMGREEVPPLVAIEVPAPGEPTSEERTRHGHTCQINLSATSASELVGEKTDMRHAAMEISHSMRQCFLKLSTCARARNVCVPMVFFAAHFGGGAASWIFRLRGLNTANVGSSP